MSTSAGILILALMVISWKQVSHWKDSVTIFKHAIRVTDKKYPDFAGVYNNLGIAFYTEGKSKEAISNYKMAIKLNSNHAYAYYNLGIALLAQKKKEEAISHYKTAIRIDPNFTSAHYNLGLILIQIVQAITCGG